MLLAMLMLLIFTSCGGETASPSSKASEESSLEVSDVESSEPSNSEVSEVSEALEESSKKSESSAASSSKSTSSKAPVDDGNYGLTADLGALPTVTEPPQKGDRVKSKDGKWALDNLCTVKNDRLIVNAKSDGTAAFYAKALGNVWKAQANFRPIKAYPAEQPTCARLFINNAEGVEVLLLTVNFIDRTEESGTNNVEIQLQYFTGTRWKALYSSNGWFESDSTVFHFEMSRAKDSKKIAFNVIGDKGELVNRTTIADVPDNIVDTPILAGFGVYSSAVEYFNMKVEGNGPATFTFNDIDFKK